MKTNLNKFLEILSYKMKNQPDYLKSEFLKQIEIKQEYIQNFSKSMNFAVQYVIINLQEKRD